MESITLKLTGKNQLLTHNNTAANPMSIEAKTLKEITSKRAKTDKDFESIARLEWESGLYLNGGVVAIPAINIERSILFGARKTKNGKLVESGVFADDDFCELSYAGTKIQVDPSLHEFPIAELDPFFDEHKDQQMVKIARNQILRTRPVFYDWSLKIKLLFDETIINKSILFEAAQTAGALIGLCEMRPRLGRFTVEEVAS